MKRQLFLKWISVAASTTWLTACGGAAEDLVEEPIEVIEPLADACPDRIQDMRGSRASFTCSCTAEAANAGTVWGSGPYSDDSTVCRAAMHAGIVGDEPANVTINFMPGRDSYTASEANGVQTSRWGSWGGSFSFDGAELGEPEDEFAVLEACPDNARRIDRDAEDVVNCSCDAVATADGTVWGTDIYTDDSRICRAAVHAGATSMEGGNVTFILVDGQENYSGSEANGVETRDYGAWSGSFEFVTDKN